MIDTAKEIRGTPPKIKQFDTAKEIRGTPPKIKQFDTAKEIRGTPPKIKQFDTAKEIRGTQPKIKQFDTAKEIRGTQPKIKQFDTAKEIRRTPPEIIQLTLSDFWPSSGVTSLETIVKPRRSQAPSSVFLTKSRTIFHKYAASVLKHSGFAGDWRIPKKRWEERERAKQQHQSKQLKPFHNSDDPLGLLV